MTFPAFEKIISIDWSGASTEAKKVDLRVTLYEREKDSLSIVPCVTGEKSKASWSRAACREWLREQLRDDRPTLVAMDFGFGLPWNSDKALFEVTGWRKMAESLADLYERHGEARAAAKAINKLQKFGGHGPYRFDGSRADYRFNFDQHVAYYRLTEMAAPQAISQWYLGSGGTVGFHTITGIAAIRHLLDHRDRKEIDFVVWPHETSMPEGSRHVLAESYPAIYPSLRCPHCQTPYPRRKSGNKYVPRDCERCDERGPWADGHQEDAWRVLDGLATALKDGSLSEMFRITEHPFGRYAGVDYSDQIRFEGYILGL